MELNKIFIFQYKPEQKNDYKFIFLNKFSTEVQQAITMRPNRDSSHTANTRRSSYNA